MAGDVAPTSGKGYIEQVQAKLKELGVGKIATIIGRYYAMDRDNRLERGGAGVQRHGAGRRRIRRGSGSDGTEEL